MKKTFVLALCLAGSLSLMSSCKESSGQDEQHVFSSENIEQQFEEEKQKLIDDIREEIALLDQKLSELSDDSTQTSDNETKKKKRREKLEAKKEKLQEKLGKARDAGREGWSEFKKDMKQLFADARKEVENLRNDEE
jgi:TolA-binding protein